MTRRTSATAAAITVGTVFLLSGCGGDDSGPDKITGVGDGNTSPSASASASHGPDRPDLSLPQDYEIVFDFKEPSDPDHMNALADAANYIRALKHGIAEQDANDEAYQFYSTAGARDYAQQQIKKWVEGGWTVHGRDRYYRAETDSLAHGGVVVTFCRNQAKSYSKNTETGQVHHTEESLNSYQKFQILMHEDSGVWKARGIEVWGKSKECRK